MIENKIDSWRIKVARESSLASFLSGAKGLVIPHQFVRAIGDIMLITKSAIPGKEKSEEESIDLDEEIKKTRKETAKSFKVWRPIAIAAGIVLGIIAVGSALLSWFGLYNLAHREYERFKEMTTRSRITQATQQATYSRTSDYFSQYGIITPEAIKQKADEITEINLAGNWIGGINGLHDEELVRQTKRTFNWLAEHEIIPGKLLADDGNIDTNFYERVREIQEWLNRTAEENTEFAQTMKEINKKIIDKTIVNYNGDGFLILLLDEEGYPLAVVPADGYFGEQTRASLVAWLNLSAQQCYQNIF